MSADSVRRSWFGAACLVAACSVDRASLPLDGGPDSGARDAGLPDSSAPSMPPRDGGAGAAPVDARAHSADAAFDAAPRDDGATADGTATDGALGLPPRREVLRVIRLVNDRFIGDHADPGDVDWARSVYFIGNGAAYDVTRDLRYLDYSWKWVGPHLWSIEGDPANADHQCAGQTYEWQTSLTNDSTFVIGIQAAVDGVIAAGTDDDWYWVDALFMAMPAFAWLGPYTGDAKYADAMYRLYAHTKTAEGGPGMWSAADGLWFRDKTYLPPAAGANGAHVFWGRGNGWAMAAHARTLEVLPTKDPHRAEYVETLQRMAKAVSALQRRDGCWNPSLLDPDHFGAPESSATSLFAYSLAWGIRTAVLDEATYAPVLARAYGCLLDEAVGTDGKVGWVQGPAGAPDEAQPLTAASTADFGVGTFLLAAAEISKITR